MGKYSKEEKAEFIEKMRNRTKKFAVDVINVCHELPTSTASRVISYQLIKSATSTAANYRAACRARSQKEFHSKISITVEEADESFFWLNMIADTNIKTNKEEVNRLINEAKEILSIVATARKNNS